MKTFFLFFVSLLLTATRVAGQSNYVFTNIGTADDASTSITVSGDSVITTGSYTNINGVSCSNAGLYLNGVWSDYGIPPTVPNTGVFGYERIGNHEFQFGNFPDYIKERTDQDLNWDPINLSIDSTCWMIKKINDSLAFVSGDFTHANGLTVNHACIYNIYTGAVLQLPRANGGYGLPDRALSFNERNNDYVVTFNGHQLMNCVWLINKTTFALDSTTITGAEYAIQAATTDGEDIYVQDLQYVYKHTITGWTSVLKTEYCTQIAVRNNKFYACGAILNVDDSIPVQNFFIWDLTADTLINGGNSSLPMLQAMNVVNDSLIYLAGPEIYKVTLGSGTGITPVSKPDFVVFPNPCTTHLTISNSTATYGIYNVSGQMVQSVTSNVIDMTQYDNGIYFLRDLKTGKTVKIIKE